MEQSANDVSYRFNREQEYVERYVQLLQAKSTLHDRQVQDLNRILKRVRCPLLPRRHYERTSSPYSAEESAELFQAIKATNPHVYQTILEYEQQLDFIPTYGAR